MTAIKARLCLAVAIMSLQEKLISSVGAMPNYDMYDSRSDSASWSDHYTIEDMGQVVQPDMELIHGRSDNADLLLPSADVLEQKQGKSMGIDETDEYQKEPATISPGLLMLSIAALCMVLVVTFGIIGYNRLAKRDLKQSQSESSLQHTTTCSNSTEEYEIKIDSIPDMEKNSLSTFKEIETDFTEVKVSIDWDN